MRTAFFVLAVSVATTVMASKLQGLELAGVLEVGEEVRVCISDPRARQSVWLVVGAPAADGLRAEQFDRESDTVVLRHNEERRVLPLREARVQDAPVPRFRDGSVDWFHASLTDAEKAHVADLMMWDYLDVSRLARLGKLRKKQDAAAP